MSRFYSVFCILFLVLIYGVGRQTMASSTPSNQSDDRTRFNSLIDLADKAKFTNPERAIEHATQALNIGERKKDGKMIAQAQFFLGWSNFNAHNYHIALDYYQLCKLFFEKTGDAEKLAAVYNALASIYFINNDSETGNSYSDQCIALAEKHNFSNILSKQYYNRGVKAYYQSDYSYSAEFALKAINIAKRIDNPLHLAYCSELMGSLSSKMTEYRKAISYHKLSMKIYLEGKYIEYLGRTYHNMANDYFILTQLDSARLFYNKSLACYSETDDIESISMSYCGIAKCFKAEMKYDSAQIYIEKSLKIGLLSESNNNLSASYKEAGEIMFQQDNYPKSLEFCYKALFHASQTGNEDDLLSANQIIGKIYASMRQFDSAYIYLSQANAINDKIFNKIEIHKRAYAFAEHNMNERLEKEKDAVQIKRQLWFVIIALCAVVIVILCLFIYFLSVRQRKIKIINAELKKYKSDLEDILQDKTRELILSEQQISNLSNNLPNGAIFRFAFDNEHEGKLLYISSGWEELTGQSSETAKDSAFFFQNRIHPDDSRELLKALANAIRNHSEFDMAYRFYKNNTEIRWFHIRAIAIEGDGITYLDGFQVDETEQKFFEQELVVARDKAEESDKLKSAFLANMSHEIRTPMNAIIGFSSLLSNVQLPPKRQNDYLELIQENCQNLLRLIDDIVDISKIEADQLNLRMELFPLSKIMTAVRDYFDPIISSKYPYVELWIDDSFQKSTLTIYADFFRLKQIFVNLIENSLKFTEKGFVRCGYLLDRVDVMHFYVMDTGSGIAHENIENIFQSFRKLDQYSGGTGLGLSIVKRMLIQMGGTIWVESEPSVGSTFHFTLPRT